MSAISPKMSPRVLAFTLTSTPLRSHLTSKVPSWTRKSSEPRSFSTMSLWSSATSARVIARATPSRTAGSS